eukprot:jgi/Mesvir1/21874/Mv04249-RA.1
MVGIRQLTDEEEAQYQEESARETNGSTGVSAETGATDAWRAEESGGAEKGEDAKEDVVLSEEEMRLQEADALKVEGNKKFAEGDYLVAADLYAQALDRAPPGAPACAIYFANRAACFLNIQRYQDAAVECTRALERDPGYVKALLRRSKAYESMEELERSLADAKRVLELESGNGDAASIVKRIEPRVLELREKQKEEVLGKLKDLGNTVLGKFGLSLDNFKATKDPATGSYSINFQQ